MIFLHLKSNALLKSFSTNNKIVPVVIYDNADEKKLDILADNRNKIGVYR